MAKRKKRRSSLEVARDNYEQAELQTATALLEHTSEFTDPVVDPDEKQWQDTADLGRKSNLTPEKLKDIQKKCRVMSITNLHARVIIRNYVKYIIGTGMTIKSNFEGSDDDMKQIQDYWNRFTKKNKWVRRAKEIVKRGFRDGEIFLRFFKTKVDNEDPVLLIRFMDPLDIDQPTADVESSFGIKTEENDVEVPITYYLKDIKTNEYEEVPAKDVQHIKLNTDSDVKRGLPVLFTCWERLRQYNTWLKDRIILNKIRTAIALIKKVPGLTPGRASSSIVNSAGSNFTDPKTGKTVYRKKIRGGTMITTAKGVEYQFLTPNVQARDVQVDGRAILLSIAAGMEQAEFMVTGDASKANYASTMVAESPAIVGFEDWQEFFAEEFTEIWDRAMKYGEETDQVPEGTVEAGCNITLSPPTSRSKLEVTRSEEILHLNHILSPQTWAQKQALDPKVEADNWKRAEKDGFVIKKKELEGPNDTDDPTNKNADGTSAKPGIRSAKYPNDNPEKPT